MAKYLVTAGAGYIGTHLVEALVARGESVRIADDFSTGLRENVPAGAVDLVQGDLANPAVARCAVAGCEYVLHQAALPSVPRSIEDPVRANRANVDATLQVLMAARDAGVRRVVFAGSSSIYGDTPTLPKREDAPPNPRSPYALQKLTGEHYCRLFTTLYGLETVVLRYFNVFGPRQNPDSPYSGVISRCVSRMAGGEPPVIHGDGRQTRDFTYVSDVAAGVLAACTAPGAVGEAINVAAGGRVSLLQIVDVLQGVLRTTLTPRFEPRRAGDIQDSQADIAKARQLLGYSPVVPFAEGLRRTVEWRLGGRSFAA